MQPSLKEAVSHKNSWYSETLKLIKEKVGKSLEHRGTGELFLNRTPRACALRSRITNGTS
jgi:hypothetical protein